MYYFPEFTRSACGRGKAPLQRRRRTAPPPKRRRGRQHHHPHAGRGEAPPATLVWCVSPFPTLLRPQKRRLTFLSGSAVVLRLLWVVLPLSSPKGGLLKLLSKLNSFQWPSLVEQHMLHHAKDSKKRGEQSTISQTEERRTQKVGEDQQHQYRGRWEKHHHLPLAWCSSPSPLWFRWRLPPFHLWVVLLLLLLWLGAIRAAV